ncbi:SDR family NAD(P)-dependent oxidoreductase, partial [Streptococcus pneumoniae]|nr:SDR family NAD(P)-dependent oxidoreductase [Streptococcus pneumoniae]
MDGSPFMQISEQLVLITGAGRGLGQHIARAFAAQGARVIVNYHRSEGPARALAAELGGQAIALPADVTDRSQVDAMLQHALAHFGQGVTTVVNNALAAFSFNGDARDGAATIGWPAFQA